MTATNDLTPLLKRLKLGCVLGTLPERLALARREHLDYAAFLQIILADEVARRDQYRLELHLQQAGFEEVCRLEDFDWSAQITLDPDMVGRRRLLPGLPGPPLPTSRDSSAPWAWASLSWPRPFRYAALRAHHSVRFTPAADFFRAMAQARVDHTADPDTVGTLPPRPRPPYPRLMWRCWLCGEEVHDTGAGLAMFPYIST